MPSLLDEIRSQPQILHGLLEASTAALADLTPWANKLSQQQIRRVVFTGMGSSFYAAYPAVIYLLQQGIDARVVESSELLYDYRALLDKNTLLVAVSQSGRSVEVAKLLESVGKQQPVIGVTNDPESPLARQSDTQLYIHAGPELTVSTKTYTCTLAALHILARALSGQNPDFDSLRRAADSIGDSLPGWTTQADDLVAQTEPNRFVIFVGRGPSRATSSTAALITKETAKVPTEGIVGGQFRHGPMEVVAAGVTTFIFAGSGPGRSLNLALAQDLGKLAGKTILVGSLDQAILGVANVALNAKAFDQWTLPIAEIVPVQLFAARLAAAHKLEAGTFFFGQKVTTTE